MHGKSSIILVTWRISNAACINGTVRLMVGEDGGDTQYDSLSIYTDGDHELRAGHVEVCVGGQYGTVCNNNWDNQEASVLCRQLGFSPHGMHHTLFLWKYILATLL